MDAAWCMLMTWWYNYNTQWTLIHQMCFSLVPVTIKILRMYDPYFHMISSSTHSHSTPVKVHVVHVSTNKQALPLSVQLGVYIAYAKWDYTLYNYMYTYQYNLPQMSLIARLNLLIAFGQLGTVFKQLWNDSKVVSSTHYWACNSNQPSTM